MKLGDIIKVKDCKHMLDVVDKSNSLWATCVCFFCSGNSNRVGFITAPAPGNSWCAMFDCGEWRADDFEEARGEVTVIGACR